MKKAMLILGLIIPTFGIAQEKFLVHHFNENVDIYIANIPCKIKQIAKENPYSVVAKRKDGQFLFGCFTHDGDMIVIQWAGGDKTMLPANAFLIGD